MYHIALVRNILKASSLDRYLIGVSVTCIFACGFISKKKTLEFRCIIIDYQLERNVGGKRAFNVPHFDVHFNFFRHLRYNEFPIHFERNLTHSLTRYRRVTDT